MFADADGVEIVWWFLGKMFIKVEGYPEILARYGDNLMIHRTQTLSPDAFAFDWIELNAPRSASTGLPETRWTNPFTGVSGELRTDTPYGPGRYIVRRQGRGLGIEVNQPFVTPTSTRLRVVTNDRRILLEQEEHKISIGPERAKIRTLMSIAADRAAAQDRQRSSVPCSGAYTSTSDQIPAFAGFPQRLRGEMIVRGLMQKAGLDEIVDRGAWDGMKATHPTWFSGDRLTPQWPNNAG